MNRKQVIDNLMDNMGSAMRLMSRYQPAASKGGPTRSQLGVLIMIAHLGVQNTKDLAVRLEMTSSAVTQLVDGLVKENLLKREEDKKDRRITWLALTSNGKKKLNVAKKQRAEFLMKLLTPLNNTDINHLNRIQAKVIAGLKLHAGQ